MTQTFSYEFLTPGTPEEAVARLQADITSRLRRPSGGSSASNAQRQMVLSKRTLTSLSYKPKLLAPLPVSISIWLGRRLRGENVDVRFAANDDDGLTHITLSGRLGRGTQALAERDFWTAVLNATPSGA
jgi:hypothetical protein